MSETWLIHLYVNHTNRTYTATSWLRIVQHIISQSQLLDFLLCFSPPTNAIFTSFPCASDFTIPNWKDQWHWWLQKRNLKVNTKQKAKKKNDKLEPWHLPGGSWGFFKSSSVNKLSSSIKSESSSIWTFGKVFADFFMEKDEPILQEGFLAFTYRPKNKNNNDDDDDKK